MSKVFVSFFIENEGGIIIVDRLFEGEANLDLIGELTGGLTVFSRCLGLGILIIGLGLIYLLKLVRCVLLL